MAFDFTPWARMTTSRVKEVLQEDFIAFAAGVSERFESKKYQDVVTYLLLREETPADIAKAIRRFIMKGELPWLR